MNEGFFADLIVLVEGESDRAAILGESIRLGHDFDALGITVIPCLGKTNIDRPAAIFRQLGIPVYPLWDGDKGRADARAEDNHRLLRLMSGGVVDWPATGAHPSFACFEVNLESTLRAELTSGVYDQCLSDAQAGFGILQRQDAEKISAVVCEMLTRAASSGHTSATLTAIVEAVIARLIAIPEAAA